MGKVEMAMQIQPQGRRQNTGDMQNKQEIINHLGTSYKLFLEKVQRKIGFAPTCNILMATTAPPTENLKQRKDAVPITKKQPTVS